MDTSQTISNINNHSYQIGGCLTCQSAIAFRTPDAEAMRAIQEQLGTIQIQYTTDPISILIVIDDYNLTIVSLDNTTTHLNPKGLSDRW